MLRLPAGRAAVALATALLFCGLSGCCLAVELAIEASGAAINAAEAQAAAAKQPAAAAAAEAAAPDDSVRCRLSGICEGPPTGCDGSSDARAEEDADARLACLTGDAERAAAVQQAARHAWGGYRRALLNTLCLQLGLLTYPSLVLNAACG